MRILFDCRYVRFPRHDGISRFSAALVAQLAREHEVTMLVSDERQLAMLPALPHVLGPSPTGPLEPLTAWRLRKVPADVAYSPMQTIGSVGRAWPLVTTVHDLIYYRHPTPPRDLPAPVRLLWRLYHLSYAPQRLLLNGVDGVVTISQTTRELIRQHRLTRRPVAIVPNAAAPLGEPVDHDSPPTKRLVYMGSFMPYKDVETLVRAAALLPGHELHLCSRIDPATRERLTALAAGASVIFHDGVSDEEYAELLRSACALVHASHEEGFGIPLLEAMSLGVPVVVADTAIFREVGGEAAVYFPVGDADALAHAVRALEGEWAARSRAARQQAATFSWRSSAERLGAFLAEVAATGRRR
ncbi:Glycosyltransferase involved in cell wall bisynthesis [Agrococcus baldri]|uniref:Glycosyltransferase involved in cell wall bisynthesis n=1 Tax=Agrococcus baldri TaxID=153730 RepID=A0AA94HPB4_9MICO|nr:glycosyltransferase family 1 protein [Agrococcus baldri]SFS18307.1 Glycosyltransferase involved in cell wall bisynthesis [Agrococcus baldri]